ncbi:MAG TPA: hypothetical protein VJ385_01785 [Fibrobacteria bacterium]|nr:hypothetical protein [Fibrobacteria bacterium]
MGSIPDPEAITPWARIYAGDHDGAELQGMTALFAAYMGVVFFAAFHPKPRRGKAWTLAAAAGCLGAIGIVLATRSWSFTALPLRCWKIHLALASGLGLAALAIRFLAARQGRSALPSGPSASSASSAAVFFSAVFWTGLAGFILACSPPPSLHDYGFFLGPANKILHGEAWGSFYQQYGLGETLLFAGMMKLGFPLSWMQAALGLILAFWIHLYHRLARRLLADRVLVLLFLAALIVVRVLASRYCPFGEPQASALRMDLWVPALLAWARFGFASPWTALAFGGLYLADNLFGMLFCGLYVAALLLALLRKHPVLAGRKPREIASLFLPAALACGFQVLVYGSPVSPAGRHYQHLNIGFLPIDPHSLFWPVALLLGFSAFAIAPGRRPLHLALFPVAAVQLIYFFGRSHENSLMAISGAFLLVFFLALDRVAAVPRRARPAYGLAALLIAASAFLFEEGIWSRVSQAGRNLSARTLALRAPEEIRADGYPDWPGIFPHRNLVFVSPDDAYLYYRFRLPTPGYWTPLPGRIDLDGTACYLRDRILAGDVALVLGWEPADLAALGSGARLRESGWTLVPSRENGYDVLALLALSR